MAKFAKSSDCPKSADLAEFQADRLAIELRAAIEEHLVSCEFCRAEAEFYRLFPPVKNEFVRVPPIPRPLQELARSIFGSRS